MKQALPVRSWANGPIREERKKEEEKKRKPYWLATAQLEGGKEKRDVGGGGGNHTFLTFDNVFTTIFYCESHH